jgi:hypothetical protein
LATPAAAQARDDSARSEAYQAARKAIVAEQWEEAERLFSALWAEERTYDVALGLGQAELNLEKFALAAEHLDFAVKNMPPREKPELRQRTRELFEFVKQRVGIVKVTVTRDGAEVRVDGEAVGTSPLDSEVFVKPGMRSFRARVGESAAAETSLEVLPGQAYVVNLDPVPTEAAPERGVPPTGEPQPDAGANAGDGATSTSMLPLYIAGGAAVALGVGVGFLVAAEGKESEREDVLDGIPGTNRCGPGTPYASDCERFDQLGDEANTFRTIGYVGLGVGIAAAGTAVALWVWPKGERSAANRPPMLAVVPAVAPGNLGARITGQF